MNARSLPIPTFELVTKEGRDFDEENRLIEESLALLWARFPHNTDTSQVLLKVLVLNKLYSTQVRDIDVYLLPATSPD